MNNLCHAIEAGDYERAGGASRALKEWLKRIGTAPDLVRRVMIAAYEAEMNVVIHSVGGELTARLSEGVLEIEVCDRGPGIPDIDRALQEGYSTAPAKARELGFGAGMGLPNIRRNADRFSIESGPGRGTRLAFSIDLRPQGAGDLGTTSVRVVPEVCTACGRCVQVCLTRAVRLRRARPEILEHLCSDCGACVAACPAGALRIAGAEAPWEPRDDTVLVAPSPWLAQFGAQAGPVTVLERLAGLGFARVVTTDGAERRLRAAGLEQLAALPPADRLPLILPVCPAVVNLVRMTFPSLLGRVVPYLSPPEAIRHDLAGRRAVFAVLCPAQQGVLRLGGGPACCASLTPGLLTRALMPHVRSSATGSPPAAAGGPAAVGPAPAASGGDDPRRLWVTGGQHVMNVLEAVENGVYRERVLIEAYACDQGCCGAPFLKLDAHLSRRALEQAADRLPGTGPLVPRRVPLRARVGIRLDADMATAIRKLGEIDRLQRALPGRDCGLCGCPTCAALAEDVVLGRVDLAVCPYARPAAAAAPPTDNGRSAP